MKVLFLNSYKIKKKQIIFYGLFILLVLLLKILDGNIETLNIMKTESLSLVLIIIIVMQFALFLIADNNLIVNKSDSYLLMLKTSRKDLLDEKFIETFIVFAINLLMIVYIAHDVNFRTTNWLLGLFMILTLISYYLILIPITIKFGNNSTIPTLITLGPGLLPFIDKIGVDPMEKVIKFYEGTNPIIPFGMILLYLILIYIVSLRLIEKKDF